MRVGGTQREQQISRTLSARERLVRSNAVKEAAAKIASRQQPPPGTEAQAKTRPSLNNDTLLSGDWRQAQKVMREAGMKI